MDANTLAAIQVICGTVGSLGGLAIFLYFMCK